MALPIGVFSTATGATTKESNDDNDRVSLIGSLRSRRRDKSASQQSLPLSEDSRAGKEIGALEQRGLGRFQSLDRSLSKRLLTSSKRLKGEAKKGDGSESVLTVLSEHDEWEYIPTESGAPSLDRQTHEFEESSPQALVATRPRHTPIVISDRPRHVPIEIPEWAEPILKQPVAPPRVDLSQSIFLDFFIDLYNIPSSEMSPLSPEVGRANTMDSNTSAPSPNQFLGDPAPTGTSAFLSSSANSSQVSLVGRRDEDGSASEAESLNPDARSHAPLQSAGLASTAMGGAPAQSAPSSNPAQLSGLVCNVHRTTGREPHPLVGATTTILGDKLYVFGGRRLSRNKPQLTSSLYELDLIKRHWSKLDAKGDIPAARYFHSMCALGDTKLVCYGGMSPVTQAPDSSSETPQPEVVVMSDIHIYDVNTKLWTKIPTPEGPQGRYAHCAAILPSSAVFASSNAPKSAIHHNPSGSTTNQGSLGVDLDGTGGAGMVVVGGQDPANHYIEQISIFNLRSLKWTGTTDMGRSCGAYRTVVTPLTTMTASQIGAGSHRTEEDDEDDEDSANVGSGAPMLIYSNYNFLDVKLELQVRLADGTLTEKPMQTNVSPPGLRFPNGGVIANHFVVSGTFLTSSKREYALWALDLRTLAWSRIDAGSGILSQGSWNRGVLWGRRNAFVILGNRKRNLVDDYNNRRINFSNMCLVELEAFGLYDNPRRVSPMSGYQSVSSMSQQPSLDVSASGRQLSSAAEELGAASIGMRELADMDFLSIDGTRIPVSSRIVARRWGVHFTNLMRESLAASSETDTATLRPEVVSHPSRSSSITITPSVTSTATTLTANTAHPDVLDTRTAPPPVRPRIFYLPHTTPTLHALLHYLYTSSLPAPSSPLATPQILCSLLQVARPYHVDGLLEAVIERLHDSLDGRNAAAIFNAAAMGAGGGDGIAFASARSGPRETAIPLRGASLASLDALMPHHARPITMASALRIDTDMANGRSTARNTLRPHTPGRAGMAAASSAAAATALDSGASTDDDDTVNDSDAHSSATDTSLSDAEGVPSAKSLRTSGRGGDMWTGNFSAVVGLQKRGLRGLMEGRRMRERGKSDGDVGLGSQGSVSTQGGQGSVSTQGGQGQGLGRVGLGIA